MSQQLDFFTSAAVSTTVASTSIVGLSVIMAERRCKNCGSHSLTLGSSAGPHWASLTCTDCGCHSGWASADSIAFINSVIDHFGRPIEPIVVRPSFVSGLSSVAAGDGGQHDAA
jgi:hypothetical protein